MRRICGSAVVLAMLLLVAACGSSPMRAPGTYTVKRGDTLYAIAVRYNLDYRDLARWNRIGRDYLIHPGQVLYLVPSSRAARTAEPRPPPVAGSSPAIPRDAVVGWNWPAVGVDVTATERPNSGRGLTLTGRIGQEIRSAAGGTVVYVGNGLLGYGQLIIIKHNDVFLSAYGHTQSVLVREGESVAAGQAVATMGEGPQQRPMLYFEIRANGQPQDPMRFLPALPPR